LLYVPVGQIIHAHVKQQGKMFLINTDRWFAIVSRNFGRYILALSCLFLIPTVLLGQIVTDKSEGCAELIVNLKPQAAQNSLYTYKWDFGNGRTASSYSTLGIYQNPGTYTVTLTITQTATGTVQTYTTIITAHAPPVVNITGDDLLGCFPHSVNFQDKTTPSAGTISSRTWYFGDGNTASNIANPQHIYKNYSSAYPVTLRIVQSSCPTDTFENKLPLIVDVKEGVKPDFRIIPPAICKPPVNIQFKNNTPAVSGQNITFNWTFEGATIGTSTDRDPIVSYPAAGKYKVTMIAKSDGGCQDSKVDYVDIPNVTVVSDFTVQSDTVCMGNVIEFMNNSTPTPDKSTWYFGAEAPVSGLNQFKTFITTGDVTVRLVDNFGSCESSVTKKIYVKEAPLVKFSSPNPYNCKAPHIVNFNYTGTSPGDIIRMDWDFGDGTKKTVNTLSTTHNYTTLGNFPVSLTVTGKSGCTNTIFETDYVRIQQPKLENVNLTDSGCVNLVFKPSVKVIAPDGVTSYLWEFGEGAQVSGPNPTHTYFAARSSPYPVQLIVTTGTGCTVIGTGSVKIGVAPGIAKFDANPREQCTGRPIDFFDQSSNQPAITGWKWEFGDGSMETKKNPTHIYQDTGFFKVKLTIYNNGCALPATEVPDFIRIKGPIARFSFQAECSDKKKFRFTNGSSNADEFLWNFGDGSPTDTSTTPAPHSFPGMNTYTVSLTAKKDGCEVTTTKDVTVLNEGADYTYRSAFGSSLCKGTVLIFEATGSDPNNVNAYQWDFGAGFVNGGRTIQKSFPDKGVYQVVLRVFDKNGCAETVTKPPIVIGGPKAGLDADIRQGCRGLEVRFSDTSKVDQGSSISRRYWDFGDGKTLTNPAANPVMNKYNTVGFFNVKLFITDDKGCEDSMVLNKYIIISDPQIQMQASDTASCPGKLVNFTNKTQIQGGVYFWEFGDGNTSTEPTPAHSYSNPGKYTVTLKVRDFAGCNASDKKIEFINIDIPVAAYDLSEDFSACPPLNPNFIYKGRYAKEIRWDFGNGGVSNIMDPQQLYQYPGEYVTKLLVTSPGGCTAEATKLIKIQGPTGKLSLNNLHGCDSAVVNFRLTNYKDVDYVVWDFDDGASRTKVQDISHTYRAAGTYKPRIILINDKGCTVSYPSTDEVKVTGIDPGFMVLDSVLCDKGTIRFRDSSKSNSDLNSWTWNFGDGMTGTGQQPIHNYTAPGSYPVRLRVGTTNGCFDTITLPNRVKVVRSPKGGIQGDFAVCQEGALTFRGSDATIPKDSSSLRWFWDFANGQTSDLQNPTAQQYRAAGDFNVRLTVTNSTGCSGLTEKQIRIHPLPNIILPADTTLCLGQSVALPASGASNFQWLAPVNGLSCTTCPSPVASPASTTIYRVRGTSPLGCVSVDSVSVAVILPTRVTTTAFDTICLGESVQLSASGTQLYAWTPSTGLNNPNIPNPIAKPTQTTTYSVAGTDLKNCFQTTGTVRITVYPIPTVNAGPDVKIPSGTVNTQLRPVYSADVQQLKWSPATGLSCTTCPNPIAGPKTTTSYTLTVTNNGACSATDALTLTVLCDKGNIFIPNTFTPNTDGMNDVFYPRGRGILSVRSMRVFNRWGEQVFRRDNFNANDISAGWNGRFNGQELVPDIYVYMIDFVCENQTIITLKGDVALVR
jgi:gliding motility-associated-like protein